MSSSGTALTTEQIRLVKRFTNNISIIYDGDEAGIKASFRGIDMILEAGMNIKVLSLPDGEDPDSFSKGRNASEFVEYIEKNEKDFISFKTQILLAEAQHDPIKRAQLITDIVRSVAVIPDGIIRSVYLKECSTLLGVEEQVLYTEVNRIRKIKQEKQWKQQRSEPAQVTVPRQPTVPGFVEEVYSEYEEREIINFLLKFGNKSLHLSEENNTEITVAQFIIREIQNDDLEFTNLVYKRVFEDVKDIIDHGGEITEQRFIYHELPEVRELAVEIYTSRYELSKIWKRKESYVELPGENLGFEVPKSLLSYKIKVVGTALHQLRQEVESIEKEDRQEELLETLIRIQNLERVKRDLSVNLGGRTVLR